MSTGPGLFADIGKKARDLLTKDYTSDQKFSISTFTDSGLALTSSAITKGGLSTGDVAALYKYKNAVFDVKVDTNSNILTTTTFSEILPSTKAIVSYKVPDLNAGKLEVQYFHEHATFTAALATNKSPSIDFSATMGTSTLVFGAEGGYDTAYGNITKYTAGLSVMKPDSCLSVILSDKGDSLKASYIHYLDQSKKTAGVAEISRKFSSNDNMFTMGGSYAVDPLTTVKAKLNNNGKLGALLQHEVLPKSVVTICGEFDTKGLEKHPKVGLTFAFKP